MKYATFAAAAVALAATANAQQLGINTPTTGVVVCQPLLLQWQGGQSPYFLSVVPGGDPSGTALIDFGKQTVNQITWTVNVTAGTSIVLTIKDSTGSTAQSAPFSPSGSDTSCIGAGGGSTGGSSSSATGSTTSTGTGTKPATTATGGTTGGAGATTSPKPTSGSGTSAAPSPSGSSAASALGVQVGILGVVSAAIFALVA